MSEIFLPHNLNLLLLSLRCIVNLGPGLEASQHPLHSLDSEGDRPLIRIGEILYHSRLPVPGHDLSSLHHHRLVNELGAGRQVGLLPVLL